MMSEAEMPDGMVRASKMTTRNASVTQLVEYQPSKLNVVGSIPIARSASAVAIKETLADSAQEAGGVWALKLLLIPKFINNPCT
jgi:hypothetical protein